MTCFLRPAFLLTLACALAGAGVVLLWPAQRDFTRPVPAGDQEVAWLNPATNTVAWERFVAAVHRLPGDRPDLGVEIAGESNPFPSQTTEVPEIAVRARGVKGRLWFRWYKLTGDLNHERWVRELARRDPPPLVVLGGGASDRAADLAWELKVHQPEFSKPPVYFITTASSERVPVLDQAEGQPLTEIYPGRTFRFCFTNGQMAEAVTEFIWSQDDLRPDALPVYVTRWEDDPYSGDLSEEFCRVLRPPDGRFGRRLEASQGAAALARFWGWFAGQNASGAISPHASGAGGFCAGEAGRGPFTPLVNLSILYSVGGYHRPNHWEEEAASLLMAHLDEHPAQRRPLLIVPASPQPARRFVRAVVSLAPGDDRRYVVASGDALDFNTVYRDRSLAWPIQDLPATLVLFCQRNPVDPVAFRPDRAGDTDRPVSGGQTPTGTQDLLLYRDVVETVVGAACRPDGVVADAGVFAGLLREAQGPDGQPLFAPEGNLSSGAGEFVVCLRPVRQGERLLPRARLQVWNRRTAAGGPGWFPVSIAGRTELEVAYTSEAVAEE
jgi:hypothetical protein